MKKLLMAIMIILNLFLVFNVFGSTVSAKNEKDVNEVTVSYTLKEIFKDIRGEFKEIRASFYWLLTVVIASFLGLATMIFSISNKIDKVTDKAHENDKQIAIIKRTVVGE